MDERDARWSLVVAAGLVIFMAQLDATIVSVALPAMAEALDLPQGAAQWVMLGYLVPLIALSLRAGRWIDRIGLRHALSVAVVAFALASLAAAVAPGMVPLLAARVGQGVAGALMMAAAPALAVAAVGPSARGRALAVVATLAPLGGMSGPALGGLLVERWGWPSIFLVNLPVSLVILGIVLARAPHGGPWERPERGWLRDVGLLGGAAVALLLSLTPEEDGGMPLLWLLPVGLGLGAVWWRTDGARDLRRLLSSVPMRVAHAAFAGTYLAVLTVQFLAPFFLREHLAASAAVIGGTMVAYPLATAAMGPVSGWATDRWPARSVAASGAGLFAVALLLLAPLDPSWSPGGVAIRLAVIGVGFGLFVTPNQALALGLAPESDIGLTSASTNLARLVGLAAGPATATAAWAIGDYSRGGMRLGILLAAGTAAASAFALAIRRGVGEGPQPPAAASDGADLPVPTVDDAAMPAEEAGA